MDLLQKLLLPMSFCIVVLIKGSRLQCSNELDDNVGGDAHPETTEPGMDNNPKVVKLVEQEFLKFMGLKKKPDRRLRDKVQVPNEMWKLYCKWSHENNHYDSLKQDAEDVHLIDREDEGDDIRQLAQLGLRFNMPRVQHIQKLRRAELLLFNEKYKQNMPLRGSKFVRIYKGHNDGANHTLISVKKVPRNLNGYIKVDITKSVEKWMKSENGSRPLQLNAYQSPKEKISHLNIRRRRGISNESWQKIKPFLFIYLSKKDLKSPKEEKRETGKGKRNRRANDLDKERTQQLQTIHIRAQKETCRIRRYYLDFVKRDWDAWIIAPRGYFLNYCLGECPRPLGRHYNTTNHAVIQNQILRIGGSVIPKLCCIPSHLKDQTFLYMDNAGKLSLKNLSEMSAIGCGCR